MKDAMKHSEDGTLDVDVFALARTLMASWKNILKITILVSVLGSVLAYSLPPSYTATSLLAPADEASGGLSSVMQQYSGLASLAGLSLPMANGAERKIFAKEMMTSRKFIMDFVERRELLPELLASKSWNVENGTLIYDKDIYDVERKRWLETRNRTAGDPPSKTEAYERFRELLTVREDVTSGFIRVSFEHHSPIIAAKWIEWLVADVNETLRAQDIAEAKRSIKYLEVQISSTPLAELKGVFFELIQKQTESMMLASIRDEYVFRVLDPPVVEEIPSAPNKGLIILLSAILGFFCGCLATLLARHQ